MLYTISPSIRTRTIRISVHHDGKVVVSAPSNISSEIIDSFVKEKWSWVKRKQDQFAKLGPLNIINYCREDEMKYRRLAYTLAKSRIDYFNEKYGYKVGKISIRNQKSRWGSCSMKGNLSFSYRIALLPKHLSDYIIVHELCHIGAFNHSKDFWNLVGKTVPDYRIYIKELKKVRFVSL